METIDGEISSYLLKCHTRKDEVLFQLEQKIQTLVQKVLRNVEGEDSQSRKYTLDKEGRRNLENLTNSARLCVSHGLSVDLGQLLDHDLPLEIVSELSRQRVLKFRHYIERLMNAASRITDFTRTLADSLFVDFERRNEILIQILSDLVVITEVFEDDLQASCQLILETVFRKYWTRINSGEIGLNPIFLLLNFGCLGFELLRPTFRRILKFALTFRPEIKIVNAFIEQSSWGFFCVEPLIAETLVCLLVPFSSQEALTLLSQVLESKEVNWRSVLLTLSAFVIRFDDGPQLVKEMVRQWLNLSLQEQLDDLLLTALLVARQAGGEGQHLFPSYQRWFAETFGDLNSSPACSGKRFTYFVDTLMTLLPHESMAVLKAHIAKPPAAPSDVKYKQAEFLSRTKARITQLDETFDTPFSTKSKVDLDVASAIEMFERTGKVPNTLLEASIFRMAYFQGKFLPTLLAPRIIPDAGDAREGLIDALRQASKIPNSLYTSYREACKKYANHLVEGMFDDEEMKDDGNRSIILLE